MKAKLIHLDEQTIEVLTIEAVKQKTTFKVLVQAILTSKAVDIFINSKQSQALQKCADEANKSKK